MKNTLASKLSPLLNLWRQLTLLVSTLLLAGCLGYPKTVEPVQGFELQRYLGQWYEIARLDHSFERGLQGVTAQYSLREDGGVRVINRGYSEKNNNGSRPRAEPILFAMSSKAI